MNQPNNGLYKAYSRASHTVNKTRQVVMLYDGAVRFMQQALDAIEKQDYETRYHKLSRVSDIIVGLQACLDFDAGGQAAKTLYDFYSAMDLKIYALHRSNDVAACRSMIAELKEMRDVWDRIDRGQETSAAEQAVKPAEPGQDALTVSA